MSERPTLVVFGRVPEAGRVKTRLVARLGSEGAARLYAAMLDDTLAATRELGVRRVLSVDGDPDDPRIAQLARRERLQVVQQVFGDLGARMAAAIAEGLAEGAGRVVIIGSDAPLAPPHAIVNAFALLRASEVVLGPADDGGYWLVGARREVPWLFEAMPWGTPAVLGESLGRLGDHGLAFGLVEPAWDVDEPADLERLGLALGADPQAAPATRAFLASLAPGTPPL